METHDTHDGTVLAPARTCGRRVLFFDNAARVRSAACRRICGRPQIRGRRLFPPLPTPRLITANLDAVGVLTHCDLFVCCESGC